MTLLDHLYSKACEFDFFQAVCLLERITGRAAIGRASTPHLEAVRFRTHSSLRFPPSAIHRIEPPSDPSRPPVMSVSFFGLTGAVGALPIHYTDTLLKQLKDGRGPEKTALRDWFDLFNHRLTSLFFRAWEKYRFWVPFARRDNRRLGESEEDDPFTNALFCFVGLGETPLRGRLIIPANEPAAEPPLARIPDLALLHYAGFLSHRPRNAINLESLLRDYFELPTRVIQFTGQWLMLDDGSRSALTDDGPAELGVNALAGERVWDAVSKFRVRIGPLDYRRFADLLPDRSAKPARKTFFLLSQLVRLYVGMELDFEVQIVLRAAEVPECELRDGDDDDLGARLGWNTWVFNESPLVDADDAVFEGEETLGRLGSLGDDSAAALGEDHLDLSGT